MLFLKCLLGYSMLFYNINADLQKTHMLSIAFITTGEIHQSGHIQNISMV